MNRQWRKILPPSSIVIPLVVIYILTYLLDLGFYFLGQPVPEEAYKLRVPVLYLASILYGFYRVKAFHPFYDKKYLQWLCLSPWSVDKQLPKGPVHLIWMDFVILAILTFLAYSNICLNMFIPLIVFLAAYTFMFFLSFQAEQKVFIILYLFLVPFTFYPFKNIYVTVLVLFLLYLLCYTSYYKSFKNFPWNTKYWNSDIVGEFKRQGLNTLIGWPFKYLNMDETSGISCLGAFILSLLLTWWLHVRTWAIDKPYWFGFIPLLSLFIAFFRSLIYVSGYRPPISLWGRFFTGQLIIPAYDKVMIVPLGISLLGFLLPVTLYFLGLSNVLNFEICFFLVFFLALVLPPKLSTWRLTGAYRISKLLQVTQARPINPKDRELYDFFAAKVKLPK